ncbi:hypothetical protein [Qipengyuania sp. YIM B01966]|uniref:hypothetical protein n=1 Tax=Qipengyuania sp. YIM B01966 TaxID=2778646 RepID=UPI0018F5B0CD|nr:hypothetical protein [Qipengyuania sp. YIM B01966]
MFASDSPLAAHLDLIRTARGRQFGTACAAGAESAECMRLQAELAELAGTYRAELLRPCALDDGALPADGFRQLCRARRTALAREVDAAERREAATRRAAAELLGEHHALAQAAERYRAELRRAADRREQTRADDWAGRSLSARR